MSEQDTGPQEGSQEQEPKTFDEAYVKQLRAEAAKYRTKAQENADAASRLAEIEEQGKSEAQKLADRLAQAEAAAQSSQVEALRYRVGIAAGIPPEFIPRLQGSSEEEMKADAESLAKHFQKSQTPPIQGKPTANLAPGATSEDSDEPVDSNEMFRRFLTKR